MQAFEPTSLEILSRKGNSMLNDSREFARSLEASPQAKLRVKSGSGDSFSSSAEKSATRRPSFKMEALQSIKAIAENEGDESDEAEESKA